MFENRQYNKPATIEYEGILEKHRNKSPTANREFFEWCKKESSNYSSYHTFGRALGLQRRTFERLCQKNGVELVFDPRAKNTPKPYRNKEWLRNQKITLNKSNTEIAEEFGWTERVVAKWVQLFGLGLRDYKAQKSLSPLQVSLIKGSVLGDGHIAANNSFIVSHAESQKDYLFWKYDILKDACSSPPSYYSKKKKRFSKEKEYECQPSYRFNTRLLDCLGKIKTIPKIDIISLLDDFGMAIWFLDDGNREPCSWRLCVAALTREERQETIAMLERKGIFSHLCKDERYLFVPAEGSRKIDEIILSNVPNNIDIIKTKILSKRR